VNAQNVVVELPTSAASESPLARARLQRKLTRAEAARRAGLPESAVEWLEEGRVYRFRSADDALLTLLLYATALGIDHDEALALAGRPVEAKPLRTNPWPRVAAVSAIGVAAIVLGFVFFSGHETEKAVATKAAASAAAESTLPAPWTVSVSVLNGSGDIVGTRDLASKIGALGYTIAKVGRADNFRYQQTVVYYQPGGRENALHLAKELGVNVAPLPGGTDPKKLVVIAGPRRIFGN
jgi:transcriptional regulator with XRE-family HTH domain